jgi:hypothetical protein
MRESELGEEGGNPAAHYIGATQAHVLAPSPPKFAAKTSTGVQEAALT